MGSIMFDLNEIKQRASSRSYQLGKLLYKSGKVSRLSVDDNTATAIVSGEHDYHVSLIKDNSVQDGSLQVSCNCPAAAYQDICKHAVAVALLVENTPVEQRLNEAENETTSHAQLVNWFKQKSSDQLTTFLMSYINESAQEFDKWQLVMHSEESNFDPKLLYTMITKALPIQSLWEWNDVKHYFADADDMFEVIFPAIDKLSVDKQWLLILKTLQRLNKVLEEIHDSGGFRFAIEEILKQKLVSLFNQQSWSDDKKADWLFSHFEEYKYDCFPDVPEDFKLTETVNQAFLGKCLTALNHHSKSGDLSDFDHRWFIQHLANPLVDQAVQRGDWRAQCRLLNMSAFEHRDYLKISSICLANNEELEAEDWLRQAYQHAKTSYEQLECQEHEIQVRTALGEHKSAWRIAWQLFNDDPSFMGYKKLVRVQEQTGVIDTQFINKVEQVFAEAYVETAHGLRANADALLDFYLDRQELEKARLWALSHKANSASLLKLANLIIEQNPNDTIALYHRVVGFIISQTNNSAYQEAIELLLKLEKMLKINAIDCAVFYAMIRKLVTEYKQKRNMMKLLKEHFTNCF